MSQEFYFGTSTVGKEKKDISILSRMVNRHGCITGATGTGKTVSLQKLAEEFSKAGIPVFMADIKGDLSGISKAAVPSEKLKNRLQKYNLKEPEWGGCPVAFWDVFGKGGVPVRATVSDLGPLLLSRLLELNDTQSGILDIVFAVSKDAELPILDLKDLRSMLQFVADSAAELRIKYGNISAASVGAIQRGLLTLENQGAELFFGEPSLNIQDLIQTIGGRGVVNILAADKLMESPKLYAVFLLWILSELYENLPEVGDLDRPKLVFFFDEAHMLFRDAPQALVDKVEQIARLIRSKGVGVFFVTQSPADIPEKILGQLGNRVQHALRAYTPRDQKAIKTVAETMRPNPDINMVQAIQELGVGEALVSFLDEKGTPSVTERIWVGAPGSQLGPITEDERRNFMDSSLVKGIYEKAFDRESAYEILQKRQAQSPSGNSDTPANGQGNAAQENGAPEVSDLIFSKLKDILLGSTGPRGGRREGVIEKVVRQSGERMLKNIIGSILGKK